MHPQRWFDIYQNCNPSNHVAVIGGGISGASTAYSLAIRGFMVTLFEKNLSLAMEASGNPQGMLYANFYGNHQPILELSLLGYNYSHQLINTLLTSKIDFNNCGIIQLAYNDKISIQQQKLVQSNLNSNNSLFNFINNTEIQKISGITLNNAYNGIYFHKGLWVSPPTLVQALVKHPNIKVVLNTKIESLTYLDKFAWQLLDNHQNYHNFANVVICNSYYATKFAQVSPIHLRQIRGQISIVNNTNNLKTVLCNNGYITPSTQGKFVIGATFKFKDIDNQIKPSEHIENLNNFREILPNVINKIDINNIDGKVAFRSSTTDYLPLVGPIANHIEFQNIYQNLKKDANYWIDESCPYLYGLYLNLAHGSKGLLTAPISGEIIANYIANKDLDISQSLRYSIHPNRFLKKELVGSK